MKILIDADACPVIKIAINMAKEHKIEVILVADDSHILDDSYAKTIIVSQSSDAADYKLLEYTNSEDIVITQDYGLAALALAKKAQVINQNGMIYSNDNIDSLLEARAIAKKLRKSSKNHLSGPKKRSKDDNLHFQNSLLRLIKGNC